MKLLVYGFKPFLGLKKNISETIVKKLVPRKDLKKVFFEVKFGREQFIKSLKKHDPDFIIGLGMCFRGKKLRIERKAVNLKLRSRNDKPKMIKKSGPSHYFASLKIKNDDQSWLSYDAGNYLCNYSMYVILDQFKNKNFAFIHVPIKFSVNKAVKFLEKAINDLG